MKGGERSVDCVWNQIEVDEAKIQKSGKVRGAPCSGQIMQGALQLLQPNFRVFVLFSVVSDTLLRMSNKN